MTSGVKTQLDRAATLARQALERHASAPAVEVSQETCSALAAAILATSAAAKHIRALEDELEREKSARIAAEVSADVPAITYLPAPAMHHEHHADHHHDREL